MTSILKNTVFFIIFGFLIELILTSTCSTKRMFIDQSENGGIEINDSTIATEDLQIAFVPGKLLFEGNVNPEP